MVMKLFDVLLKWLSATEDDSAQICAESMQFRREECVPHRDAEDIPSGLLGLIGGLILLIGGCTSPTSGEGTTEREVKFIGNE